MSSVSYLNSHTFQEINNQPQMWSDTYRVVLEKKEEIKSFMSGYYNEDVTVIFTGAGTSSFIGNILQFMMYRFNITNHKSIATTDITTHAEAIFNKNKKYILVSLARSGNSPESIAAVDLADSICGHNIAHVFVTCNSEGKLAQKPSKENILTLVLPSETNDKGVAMTSSFTSMLLTTLLIFDIDHIEAREPDIDLLCKKAQFMLNKYLTPIEQIASLDFERAVFLGSGELKGIAEECHLKLQELTDGNVICLFDSFLGFRHGPKAALNDKTLLVYLFSDNEKVFQYEKDLVYQINEQIQPVAQIYVSQSVKHFNNLAFQLEMIPEKSGKSAYEVLLFVLIGQLLGLFKSYRFNLDPDNPSMNGKITRVVEGVTIYQ
jgi:tagatose-6-phosphate ketose/aldose isomerase